MSRTFWTPLLILAFSLTAAADPASFRCYVQLIRGVNDSRPPSAAAKPIGPRLSKCLTSVFRWKNYWEVERQAAVVEPGKTRKLHLNNARDVELELVSGSQVELRLLRNGAMVRKSRFSSQSKGLEIMGGSQQDDKDNCWFVVVRQDPPQQPAK